ncbi:MAG TPA: DUF4159 domain-containing protein [Vicinamibacterales bacterium]|nr:DUF4159 domain-containing protein [Vicinamibacterales bacterium]
MRTRLIVALLVAALAAAGVATAQRRRGFGGGGFGYRSVKMMTPDDYNGAFLFCRIIFRTTPDGDGGNWGVDYPRADINLTFRLSELTKTPVTRDEHDGYNHVVIQLTDPLLYKCPFIMMTEVGNTYLDEREAAALRDYALKGGFLWADDFWGERAFGIWTREISKAFPPEQYPIIDVPLEHQLFHILYDVRHIPQIPSINFWAATGSTSERFDSAVPHVRAIVDETGRIMVLMTHNTDFGDAFEREGDDHEYFLKFAPDGYAFGVNAILYSMTH